MIPIKLVKLLFIMASLKDTGLCQKPSDNKKYLLDLMKSQGQEALQTEYFEPDFDELGLRSLEGGQQEDSRPDYFRVSSG